MSDVNWNDLGVVTVNATANVSAYMVYYRDWSDYWNVLVGRSA